MANAAGNEVGDLIARGLDRDAARLGAAGPRIPNGEPMDPLSQLAQLAPALGAVVAGLHPSDLDRPTPCSGFTVRGVLEHMIGGGAAFAAAYRGEEPAEPDTSDPIAAIQAALGDLIAAMSGPGALERTVQAPFGLIDGERFARFIVLDGLVHGWDLAMATGQAYDPPAEVVAEADAFARQVLDPLRDGDTFTDAVEAPAGASPIVRLAAYTGRQPTFAVA